MASRSVIKIVHTAPVLAPPKRETLSDSLSDGLKLLGISPPVSYPKNALLFMQGQAASGIFVVWSGRVKLSTSSLDGRAIILKFAGAGELLGLPAALAGRPYEVTAEIAETARINFVPRAAFLRFLRANPEAAIQAAQLMTEIHFAHHDLIQSLALSRSASEKLARFFLAWSADHADGQDLLPITPLKRKSPI